MQKQSLKFLPSIQDSQICSFHFSLQSHSNLEGSFRDQVLEFIITFTSLSQCEKYHNTEHDISYTVGPQ